MPTKPQLVELNKGLALELETAKALLKARVKPFNAVKDALNVKKDEIVELKAKGKQILIDHSNELSVLRSNLEKAKAEALANYKRIPWYKKF